MAVNESIRKAVPRTQFPNRVLSLLGNSVKDQKVVSYQEGCCLLGKFPKSTEARLLPDLLSGRYLAR